MLDTYSYKYTHSEYIIIIAFPQQQWLHEGVSLLRYANTACTPKKKEPDNNEIHVSVLKCGSSVWKIFRVATLAHEIWRHFLDFWIM
jgi:hypothetical protein